MSEEERKRGLRRRAMFTSYFTATVAVGLAVLFAIGFSLWLDSGCSLQGVITSTGKTCI